MVTYNAATPEQYLQDIADDWRRDTLLELRTLIKRAAPSWQEVMHYKMLGYGEPGAPVMHLNAQKHYVGLYVGNVSKVDPDRSMLGDIDCGKGCVRFKRKNDPLQGGVQQFIERYVALKQQGVDLGC